MEVSSPQFTAQELIERNDRSKKIILWLGIVSIIMLFAGLTSGYVVRQGEGKWVQFQLPAMFLYSTLVILLSSITMWIATASIKKGEVKKFKLALYLTFVLGLLFCVTQYFAWTELYSRGIAFSGTVGQIKGEVTYLQSRNETLADVGTMGNVAGSFLYVITGLHLVHLFIGIIAIFVVVSRASAGRYTSTAHNGVIMAAIYWHFLDLLWVYLYLFLFYIR
ncbi:MAG: hypothetical protein RIQ89_332 [Bacteroidota bacterium]|jgi:cytochrome c oxidase subunit III